MGGFGQSDQRSNASENVWGPQGDALEGLWEQAQGLFDNSGQYSDIANNQSRNLDGYNQGIMDSSQTGMNNQMGGGSFGNTDDVRNMLMENMTSQRENGSSTGNMYQSIVGGPGNTYIDPMVDSMKSGVMDNLTRMQSNTGLDASSMGQGGSSRHAMQNAMLGSQANKDMMQQEANMRGGAYDKDMEMKMGIANMADSNTQMNNDRLMSMMQGADSNQQAGMGFGEAAMNLGMGSMNPNLQAQQAQWNPITNFANIIGDPTVLGSANSKGNSMNMSGGTELKAK